MTEFMLTSESKKGENNMKYLIDRNKLHIDIFEAVPPTEENIEIIRKVEEVLLAQPVLAKVAEAEAVAS